MFSVTTLLKKGWRSDRIWTAGLFYKSFFRRIPLYFDTRALLESQYWSREKIEVLQGSRLESLLRDAEKVPFWREIFKIRNVTPAHPWESLAKLPVVSRKDLIARGIEQTSEERLRGKSVFDHTSGSTGRPLSFYFDRHAELRSFAVTERMLRTAVGGIRLPVVYMRSRYRQGFTPYKHLRFFLRGYTSVRHRLNDLAAVAKKFSVGFILYGYTSSVVEVARRAEEAGLRLPVRAVMATGEHIRPSDRALIERALHADFFLVYASREAGWLGYECEQHNMHINEEWAYIEVADDDGVSLPPGKEGRLVVTTFDNRVMPFIRYDIGDRGIISKEPCPCGRTSRTIRLSGRQSELVELGNGRTVALLDILAAIDSFPGAVRQFQIIQTGATAFDIKVVPGPFFEEGKVPLAAVLIGFIHPHALIHWDIVDEIPHAASGKALYFVRAPEKNT